MMDHCVNEHEACGQLTKRQFEVSGPIHEYKNTDMQVADYVMALLLAVLP
jgi:hypothetical protein